MSKKYMMVIRNFSNGTLKFPYCDISRQEIDDCFTIHLRDLVAGSEDPFFMQPGADTVQIDPDNSAAYGFWYLTAYEYEQGADEVDLSGRPAFAYCAYKMRSTTKDWQVWFANDCSVCAPREEADETLFAQSYDGNNAYTPRIGQLTFQWMLTRRMLEVELANAQQKA